jgi:hypothetical protein
MIWIASKSKGDDFLNSEIAFIYMFIIGVCSVIPTFLLAMLSKHRFVKYVPVIVILVLAIIFCIVHTAFYYSRYIGIVYVGVLMIIAPACILCIVILLIFEFIRYIKRIKVC